MQSGCCLARGDDRDAFSVTESQHIPLVSGSDQIRSTREPDCQDRVVLRVRRQIHVRQSGYHYADRFQASGRCRRRGVRGSSSRNGWEGEPGIDMAMGVDPRRFGDYATRACLVKKNEGAR